MSLAIIHLHSACGRGGKDWDQGFVTRLDAEGVEINSRDDWRGDRVFYPMQNVARVEYTNRWR